MHTEEILTAGTIVRFNDNGTTRTGYITRVTDEGYRVCVGTGNYHTVTDPQLVMLPTDQVATPMSGFDLLNEAIANRTGGKLLGEMTPEELRATFAASPIMFKAGKAVV